MTSLDPIEAQRKLDENPEYQAFMESTKRTVSEIKAPKKERKKASQTKRAASGENLVEARAKKRGKSHC